MAGTVEEIMKDLIHEHGAMYVLRAYRDLMQDELDASIADDMTVIIFQNTLSTLNNIIIMHNQLGELKELTS